MNEFTEQANRMVQDEANQAAADEQRVLNEEAEIALNVQVTIIDEDGNPVVDMSAEVAAAVMRDVDLPLRGPVTEGQFQGDYFVDTPKSWWDALVESGEDFWAETGNVIVTIVVP